MSKEAMKLALEALQKIYIAPEHEDYIQVWWPACEQAITALREALASEAIEQPAPGRAHYEDGDVFERIAAIKKQPAQQEPVAWMNILEDGYKCLTHNPIPKWTSLYTSPPAQPQQEPVAQQAAGYVAVCEVLEQVGIGALSRAPSKLQIEEMCNAVRTLYTSPPAQEFVCSTGLCHYRKPLTDERILHFVDTHIGGPSPSYPLDNSDWINFARAIEAAHGINGDA